MSSQILANRRRLALAAAAALGLGGCALTPTKPTVVEPRRETAAPPRKPKVALALGGGAARGFAHIGVIKALEAQGIVPDIVVGTSAGSVVGALYAYGYSGFDLQKIAVQLDEVSLGDWSLPDRGLLKGEALQNLVNTLVKNQPIERFPKAFAAVATELQSGETVVFRSGNAGIAVRASSTVPGVFKPTSINSKEYVDGGLVSPVPVRIARNLGADVVIAVDISARPSAGKVHDTLGILLQTFAIMGQSISGHELKEADVVLRPHLAGSGGADFHNRHIAIIEGEKAVQAALPALRRFAPAATGA